MSLLALRCWLHLLSQVESIRRAVYRLERQHVGRTTDDPHFYQRHVDLSKEHAQLEQELNDEITEA